MVNFKANPTSLFIGKEELVPALKAIIEKAQQLKKLGEQWLAEGKLKETAITLDHENRGVSLMVYPDDSQKREFRVLKNEGKLVRAYQMAQTESGQWIFPFDFKFNDEGKLIEYSEEIEYGVRNTVKNPLAVLERLTK